MVLSVLHYAPSAAASVLTIYIAFGGERPHRFVSYAAVALAALGLYGFLTTETETMFQLGFHSIHGWIGVAALALLLVNLALRGESRRHCGVGRAAGLLSAVSLGMGLIILLGLMSSPVPVGVVQVPVSSVLPEVEAPTFMGAILTPINNQLNNAIEGTQQIDRNAYRLQVTGLVDRELSLSYTDLLKLPAYAEVVYLPCVEGWGFNAKWTGFRVTELLDTAGVQPSGNYAVFWSSDGYSTALPLSYLEGNQTLLAYGLNDVTLPPDRGFPLQLVAGGKYGYKWAKWVVEVEVVSAPVRGYWESRGYSDSADVGTYPYG